MILLNTMDNTLVCIVHAQHTMSELSVTSVIFISMCQEIPDKGEKVCLNNISLTH